MALQICPKCRVKATTWSIDEEESPWTEWWCRHCKDVMEEDEAQNGDCPQCGSERSCHLVRDKEGFHRWCCRCGLFVPTTDRFQS
jgi:hypothetical protein